MKLKKWLSRGLVLAMVLALMVPVPVAAKGNGGGKLVKSVEAYYQNPNNGRWELSEKQTFTYDKKNNPSNVRYDDYSNYVLGIPTASDVTLYDFAFKYKGKTPKSLKVKNSAGTVVESQAYKKGLVVKENNTVYTSEFINGVEKVGCSTSDVYYTYGKKGYVSEVAGSGLTVNPDGSSTQSLDGRSSYAWTLSKKGLPSFMLRQYTFTDGNFYKEYHSFNAKGLLTETGDIDSTTAAPTPAYVYQYEMKKGLVKNVIVYQIDPETKAPTAVALYKFKYGKTKISAARYSKMINSFIHEFGTPGAFNWY